MRRLSFGLLLCALALLCVPGAAWGQQIADIAGSYARPNGDPVEVFECEGLLCGRITAGEREGFEMFHGMSNTGPNQWQGRRMKHPSMPGFMTFNGTVTADGDAMSVRGCAIGQAFCDAETWTRQR